MENKKAPKNKKKTATATEEDDDADSRLQTDDAQSCKAVGWPTTSWSFVLLCVCAMRMGREETKEKK
jgi:hypothetical protein